MVKPMKKVFLILIVLIPLVLLFSTCDPIFFIVSEETKLNDPRIDGSPTKIVEAGGYLWVASGKTLWQYNGSSWSKFTQSQAIRDIAATAGYIYINTGDNSGIIKRSSFSNISFSDIINSPLSDAQSIYGIDNILFISDKKSPSQFSNFYLLDAASEPQAISIDVPDFNMSVLNGVAKDSTNYYLCSTTGIFKISPSQLGSSVFIIESDKTFTGIININDNIIAAIARGGSVSPSLHLISEDAVGSSVADFPKHSEGRTFFSSGALGLWYKPGAVRPSLLLVGRQDNLQYSSTTDYINGYLEISLDEGDENPGKIIGSFREPGTGSPASVDSNERFKTTLGKNPVNSIIQAPSSIDSNMTLFASTQQRGVWSYRPNNNGEMYWNAEE